MKIQLQKLNQKMVKMKIILSSLFKHLTYELIYFFIKVTTDGSRRLYAITGLKKDQDYQIKLAAMTVNGTGPATSWMAEKTLVADLDESVVPEPPSGIKAMSSDTTISIAWLPPRHNRIMVRGWWIFSIFFQKLYLAIRNKK